MKGKEIQKDLFYHLRFNQHKYYLATEVAPGYLSGISDILAYSKGKFYEYEVKTTINDLRADKYKECGNKHKYYNEVSDWFTPDYFYFVVLEEIKDKALRYILKHFPKYGLISYKITYNEQLKQYFKDFILIKRAKILPKGNISSKARDKIIDQIVKRMGSMIYFN